MGLFALFALTVGAHSHVALLAGLGLLVFGAVGVVTRNVSPSRGMDVYGHSVVSPFQYVGPNPYLTGGDPLTAQQFKLGVVESTADFLGLNAGYTAAVAFHYNVATGKMQAFWDNGVGAAMAEVTNGTDLSGYTGNSVAFGKG